MVSKRKNGMFYLASPMPHFHEMKKKNEQLVRNQEIADNLEKLGIRVYLPQRDTDQKMSPRKILSANLDAIKKSKALILVLSDARGIYFEAGYAKAVGKPVIGLRVQETRELGTIVRNFLDNIVNSVNDLTALVNKIENGKTGEKKVAK